MWPIQWLCQSASVNSENYVQMHHLSRNKLTSFWGHQIPWQNLRRGSRQTKHQPAKTLITIIIPYQIVPACGFAEKLQNPIPNSKGIQANQRYLTARGARQTKHQPAKTLITIIIPYQIVPACGFAEKLQNPIPNSKGIQANQTSTSKDFNNNNNSISDSPRLRLCREIAKPDTQQQGEPGKPSINQQRFQQQQQFHQTIHPHTPVTTIEPTIPIDTLIVSKVAKTQRAMPVLICPLSISETALINGKPGTSNKTQAAIAILGSSPN
eukprot:TRINITY_DN2078_c0_g1_i2.p3 TRINITY_DN2078_c0_g1~~TRINITY_DN2078_c0_g1_i2.p3  ORF type:complete len:267 (+),score=-4.97 TRINITY_DN2078_c0_g1_i2:127-927(+)